MGALVCGGRPRCRPLGTRPDRDAPLPRVQLAAGGRPHVAHAPHLHAIAARTASGSPIVIAQDPREAGPLRRQRAIGTGGDAFSRVVRALPDAVHRSGCLSVLPLRGWLLACVRRVWILPPGAMHNSIGWVARRRQANSMSQHACVML